jgi:ribosomal protein S18 acetylase RimI-like enzyme
VRRGVPFRDAHHRVGRLVASGAALAELSPEDLVTAGFEASDHALLSVEAAVRARSHRGGTGPDAVATQLEELGHAITRAAVRFSVHSFNVSAAGPDDPDVTIRPFGEDDYLPIAERVEEWYSAPMKAILLRRFVHHFGSTSFVAWRAGERVGYVIGWLPPDRADEVFVHAVTLAPSERGRGTGRMLYAALADLGRRAGRRRMVATIRPSNEGSLAFHRALGFVFRTAGAEPDARGIPILAAWDGPDEDRVLAEGQLGDLRL